MNDKPKVSVIIPTYNREKLLKCTIDSILSQTYDNYELIVVDDGSTDNTKSLVKSLSGLNPNKIRYLYQKNGGCYSARNKGLMEARGEFISILDSDDLWVPFFLDIMVAEFEKKPNAGMVYCNMATYNPNKKVFSVVNKNRNKSGDLVRDMALKNIHICHGRTLIRKSCISTVGFFDELFRTGGDREFNFRFSKAYKIFYVDSILFINRQHGNANPLVGKGANSSHIGYVSQIKDYDLIFLKKLLEDNTLSNYFHSYKNRISSEFFYKWGLHYFVRGNLKSAIFFFQRSLRFFPFHFKALLHLLASKLGIYNVKESERINDIESSLS